MILDFISTFLPFLLVITVLVFIHELGHYWPARRYGIRVDIFSIGFGPELIGFTDSRGTRWRISALPFGGYVRYLGDANAASTPDENAVQLTDEEKKVCLQYRPVWERIVVNFWGPFANYVFAFVLFSFLFFFYGQKIIPAEISGFSEKSIAKDIGMEVGDQINSINDQPVESIFDIGNILSAREDLSQDVVIKAIRNNEEKVFKISPKKGDAEAPQKLTVLGIYPSNKAIYKKPDSMIQSVNLAAHEVFNISWTTLKSFGQMFTGQKGLDGMSGPVGIAQLSGQVAKSGIVPLLFLMCYLSVSLGLFNLLPFPMLDGGNIVFYTIEKLRGGKPVSIKTQERLVTVGALALFSLMLLLTWKDVLKIFK